MNPLTWFQSATPCSTSHPCLAPRIVGAEYVLCWNVIMITVSYTLHNFLAAVLTMIHGSAHLYQTQKLGNMCCTPCIQTQYAQRKVLNCYDSIHYPWFTCLSLRRWIRSWITVWFYRETSLYYPELLSRSIQTPFTANGKFGIPILFNTVLLFSGKKWL